MPAKSLLRLAAPTTLLCTFSISAATLVAPNNKEATAGSTSQSAFYGAVFQMQIGASQLGAMPVGSSITGLSYRADSATGPSPAINFSDVEMTLGQGVNTVSTMSTTYAANMSNPQLVMDGPLSIPLNSHTGGSTPNPFSYTIAFDTPYQYQGGDLVILVRNSTGSLFAVDGIFSSDPDYASVRLQFSSTGFNATTATATSGIFPILQLHYTPVPEPHEYALVAGLGLAGFAMWRRQRRAASVAA